MSQVARKPVAVAVESTVPRSSNLGMLGTASVIEGKLEPVSKSGDKLRAGTKVATMLDAVSFQAYITTVYDQTKGREANGVKRMKGILEGFRNSTKETIKAALDAKAQGLVRNTDQYTRTMETGAIYRAWLLVPNAIEILTAETVEVVEAGEKVTSGYWRHRLAKARQIVKQAKEKQAEHDARAEAYAKGIDLAGENATAEDIVAASQLVYEVMQQEAKAEEAASKTPEAAARKWAKACVSDGERGVAFAFAFARALKAAIEIEEAALQAKILAKLEAGMKASK